MPCKIEGSDTKVTRPGNNKYLDGESWDCLYHKNRAYDSLKFEGVASSDFRSSFQEVSFS